MGTWSCSAPLGSLGDECPRTSGDTEEGAPGLGKFFVTRPSGSGGSVSAAGENAKGSLWYVLMTEPSGAQRSIGTRRAELAEESSRSKGFSHDTPDRHG